MTFHWPRFVGLCALFVAVAAATVSSARAATAFEFATVDQGRAVVATRDEYVQRLSALERALKTRSELPVSEAEFLQRLSDSVQPWADADRALVQDAISKILAPLQQLNLPLPGTVLFVRTSGQTEGNAPHTRSNAIILTEGVLSRPQLLARVLAHELFHIASRQDKAWRDAMYATIGFVPIEEVVLPEPFASHHITNPDAPRIDVAIKIGSDDGPVWVTPLLLSSADRYDTSKGGEFFGYLRLAWLEVARGERTPQHAELTQPPRLRSTGDLRGFSEQVGRNTVYIIHAEEILADNFAQLVTGQSGPSPEVHQRVREALQKQASIVRR